MLNSPQGSATGGSRPRSGYGKNRGGPRGFGTRTIPRADGGGPGGGGQRPAGAGGCRKPGHGDGGRLADRPDRRRRLAAGGGGQHRLRGRELRHGPPGRFAGRDQHRGRHNILAYNLTTGELLPFAPALNAQAFSVAASPDGSRIYVGGDFTSVNGASASRVAALDPVTGALIPSFLPKMAGSVRAIVPTAGTVYLGGLFTAVGSVLRNRAGGRPGFQRRDSPPGRPRRKGAGSMPWPCHRTAPAWWSAAPSPPSTAPPTPVTGSPPWIQSTADCCRGPSTSASATPESTPPSRA